MGRIHRITDWNAEDTAAWEGGLGCDVGIGLLGGGAGQ
jgi:hypothetical protein